MKSYFQQYYDKLKYPIGAENNAGLRNAQIGASHALASYNSLHSKNTAIMVMPTGSGKTTIIMMAPYVLRKNKVLIVTPSKMVRGQITEDFRTLGTLVKACVFSASMKKPTVYELEHKYKEEFLTQLKKADVIVATPSCALSLSETEWAKNNIDMVEIDEAHHVPAQTWTQILMNLPQRCHVLFTATPFRLDRKEIIGEIVYDYPLSRAYEDGIFGEIKFIPVEDGADKHIRLAQKAEEVLLNDRNAGLEHYLMVRTDKKDNALNLEAIYSEHTSLKLRRIDSSTSHAKVKDTLEQLRKGELHGIICVNMLGEGYDFPNLKIAAIHEPHRSLASTLQFIGRFARTNAANIGSAKFIAINDEELQIENNALYAKDAVWQDMIIGMSEGRNQQEVENRKYYKDFSVDETSIMENVPIQSIRPNCHDKVYRVTGFNIDAEFPESCNVSNRTLRNRSDFTVVGIGLDYESPLWMGGGEKIDKVYSLYIIHYQASTRMVHIYSPKHTEAVYEELVSSFCDSYEPIPKADMNRVLGDMEGFEIFNSGMLNRQSESGESYRILAGSDVSSAIDPETGKIYSAGHAFCKATDKNTKEEVTVGYSSASKVWSSSYKELRDFVSWCDSIGNKIANPEIQVKTNTNFDFLPTPERLKHYPNNIFFMDFSAKTYSSTPIINAQEFQPVMLTDCRLCLEKYTQDKVTVRIEHENFSTTVECDTDGHYSCVGTPLVLKSGKKNCSIAEYLMDQPLIFRTLDDATINGIDYYPGDFSGDVFDVSSIEGIDWNALGTNVKLEFNKPGRNSGISIQESLKNILVSDGSFQYIVYDHGSGEIADYITVTDNGNEVTVALYHVKKMGAANFNSTVGDIYEVCGQAVKSTTWFSTKGNLIDKLSSRHSVGHCVLVRGKYEDMIRDLKSSGKLLRGEIVVVQPSISKSVEMPDKFQEVLAATSSFIKRAGKVNSFRIMGSP